jgi:alkane 1-monooxygenase
MNGTLRNWLYVLSLTPAVAVIYGNLHGGIWTLTNVLYSLVFLALIEWTTPSFVSNEATNRSDTIPNLILLLHIPFQLASLLSLFYGIQHGIIDRGWIVAAAVSTGVNSGSAAIVVSHEYIHRKRQLERFFGKLLLFTAGNMYFYIDHLMVHHKLVGTSQDHASARRNESIYTFFVRSVTGQLLGAIRIESKRMVKEKRSAFSLHHYVYRQFAMQFLLIGVLFYFIGIWAIVAYAIQCFFANYLLEYVNYTQHYGLSRNENERVTEMHSWDCDQLVSRFVLVDLSRHADHHAHATKPYHTLLHVEQSPKLPSGYAGLFFFASIPQIWYKMVHPILDKQGAFATK